ncbi:MAG TPA: alpha/beta fold hydrolase [Thermoanaerobaculia bacterium]|jgi:pimeloyl-ACP methyl ester carboxylesterase|nr:alpha/beta fold hydrolase [Thermoanaerobaculia bacterium]
MNTILWLHGFPLTNAIFVKQLAIAGVEHVMPELPPLESMDDYARFAIGQLDLRGIEKATFAGLSMGGYICFAALRLFPERVSGLILVDTRETADTADGRKGRFEMIEKAEKEGVAPIAEAMLPKMLTPAAPPELRQFVRDVMMSTSREFVIAALRAMAARPDSSSLLPTIRVPTLVVVGEEDPITPPKDAERMASTIPNAKLVKLARAAHLSNVERATEFNAAVTQFQT